MTKRKVRSRDEQGRVVVDAFVSFLRDNGNPGLKVDRRPDEENHETPDIDAIAGHFAIEHTSVDTVTDQRRDTDYFKRVVDGIASELRGKLGCRLRITVEWSAVKKGPVWAAIHEALKDWILTTVPNLPDGVTVIEDGTIAGVPFGLRVMKASDRPPGIFFARCEPLDGTLSVEDRERLEEHAGKLATYKPCKTTILLVESSDMALMNRSVMLGALKTAFSDALPTGVDQVWYADTSVSDGETTFENMTEDIGA